MLASDIRCIILMLQGKSLRVPAEFIADIVLLATSEKWVDPAPNATVDQLLVGLFSLSGKTYGDFESEMRVHAGDAVAKVCMSYIEKGMFTIGLYEEDKYSLIIADYMFHDAPFSTIATYPLFQKHESWPDFLIFYEPSGKKGGVVPVGFILNQFAAAINSEPDSLVSPLDFERVLSLSPEKSLSDDDLVSMKNIVTLMVSLRLFTERKVVSAKEGGSFFRGWYFCKGCFQSYIEKSTFGCKGGVYINENGEPSGKCGSLIRKPQT